MEQALAVIKWTKFFDMHSGGGQKLDWSHIYIEAPEAEAVEIFKRRFGRDPNNVTCDCCGEDFAVYESDDLREASRYERGCGWEGDEESRDKSMDDWLRETVKKDHKKMSEKIQKLWAMAKDKGSPKEAAIAWEKLLAEPNLPWWNPITYVPFEEFERTGRIAKRAGSDGGFALILRAADIASDRDVVPATHK